MSEATDIAILHERQEFHKKELELMKGEFKEFKNAFRSLSDSINSIRWVAIGCAGFFLVDQLGFVEALKALML